MLDIDLNELVNNEIDIRTEKLRSEISYLRKELTKSENANRLLQRENDISNKFLFLANTISDSFSKITKTKRKDYSNDYSVNRNRYVYIENIMRFVLNIEPEYKGWYGDYYENNNKIFIYSLAINYYNNKDILVNLLNILDFSPKHIDLILSFQMPFDYSKDDVLEFVRNPKYNTNGNIFGIHNYWIEAGASKEKNMPYDLIFNNKYILDDDVFETIIDNLNNNKNNSKYFYSLPIYNKNISKEKIQKIGECLINYRGYFDGSVENFIKSNIKILNTKTLDYLFEYISSDNQFELFYWQNFPIKYQKKFLMKQENIDDILKILSDRNCKWSIEDKDNFLKDYYNR